MTHPAVDALGTRLVQKRARLGGLRDDCWSLGWAEFLSHVPAAAERVAS